MRRCDLNPAFYPGRIWTDTDGKRIQAHGGSVFYENGIYYWYGENKEKTNGTNGIWHWGVRCYSSCDLYHWEDRGVIIPPEFKDRMSSLHPSSCMDRPHIIFNRQTGKYVCWLKIMNPDGKAYYFFEKVHSETVIAELTGDYTDVSGVYSTHFPHPHPPFVREATAHFMRNGKHYLITSGTTGYFPNPSEVAVADDWHGPYTVLGDPHPGDGSHTSFHSQISSVFKVHGKKDLYIAVADRWLPGQTYLCYEDYAKTFESMFSRKKVDLDKEKKKLEAKARRLGRELHLTWDCKDDTSIADYVWLPLRFIEPNEQYPQGMVLIDWQDQWSLDEFEDAP